MEYLIRMVHTHESFRKPELEALATLHGVDLKFVEYHENSPFCIVRVPSEAAARTLISRAILSHNIYELWGKGSDYESVYADVRSRTESRWTDYQSISFRFTVVSFQGKRTTSEQRALIESFSFLGFEGPIVMTSPDEEFCIFEHYTKAIGPTRLYLGRLVGSGHRRAILTYDLKKRHYINTTSMDSELALITANMALARPGTLFCDPFMGTGSFPIACAHFGATTMGSDMDSRSIRGKKGRDVVGNFKQYDLSNKYLDGFISDITLTPLRQRRYLDGIVCDPPYGVREGLKVLGRRDGAPAEPALLDGKPAYLQEGYIPPRRPYSLEAMMDDILFFAAVRLVDDGRLSMWMPTANDEDTDLAIPSHPCLELVSVCVQAFNKWSRRLLTYRRLAGIEADLAVAQRTYKAGTTADELNSFRKKFFAGFRKSSDDSAPEGQPS